MSSGQKLVVINPLERALSTDINRLQAFSGAGVSELLRALINTETGTDDLDAAGLVQPNTTLTNPMVGEVLSGFLFVPTNAGTSSAIGKTINATNLLSFIDDTASSPDDSIYKIVNDPGTDSAATPAIALTPNSSGSTRIDVLECSFIDGVTLETDSRDIFDNVAGTFAAASVQKVTATQLHYRIRRGTPGSGYPGGALGWLPLYVMNVPNATTTWDTVTIWDVRPLASDRTFQPFNLSRNYPRVNDRCALATPSQAGSPSTNLVLSGIFEGTFQGRRVGGRARRGTPGTDNNTTITLGPTTTDNLEAGFTAAANQLVYLYLLFPLGLPRWARYTDASAGTRQPRSPRGILVMSTTNPNADGTPSSAITLPSSMGLSGASTSSGICVAATFATNSTHFYPWTSDGKMQFFGTNGNATPLSAGFVSSIFPLAGPSIHSQTSNEVVWELLAGTHYPGHAKRLFVGFIVSATGGSASAEVEQVLALGWPFDTTNLMSIQGLGSITTDGGGAASYFRTAWVPIGSIYPQSLGPTAVLRLQHTLGTSTGTFAIGVLGWEF